ncbi:MAG: hypothetical protein DWQ49_03970 [Bacteroidetes bacterium]|nr:MAG: hypothetical protein DWQ49_03970 [Bacteroidota bacterium]
MTDEAQTITIDDVEYEWEALPDGIKHIVNQISHCRNEVERLLLETQRMEMMQRGYTSELKDGMKEFLEQ